MGFALSWIGVRGKAPDSVLAELGYRRSGEQEELPESPAVCAQLDSGWFIVVLNNSSDAFDGTIDSAPLSRGAEVVTCMVEEHVMVSGFSHWKDGTRVLAVGHDADRGIRHLDVEGTLPSELKHVVDDGMGSQEDGSVDYVFDIAIELAHRVTGFRHDHDLDGGAMFDVLERRPSADRRTSRWWSSFIGKRRD